LPRIAPVYGRQTERASEIVRLAGYVAGSFPGHRLLQRLSIATSDDTVLRRVRQEPVQVTSALPIRNLGVDDWAWRKGQDYGTILVNLDLRQVVDLLPDRAAESFSEWRQSHPEVVTISGDRRGLYAEGATLGAPQSQQVADRFHLILNLSATMERVLEERSRELILPPLEDPAAASKIRRLRWPHHRCCRGGSNSTHTVAITSRAATGALSASRRLVQLRPIARCDQPGPWHG
jgi:hypothetical protein